MAIRGASDNIKIYKINDSKEESIDYINNLNKYISMVLSV
jgi:hypothetical protein